MSAEMNPMNTMSSLNDSVQLIHQKLLDLAIRGKLTDQRPDEKLSEEVLALPEVEGPFEIPVNWKWVTLSSVTVIQRGGSPRPIKDYLTKESNGINWIKIGDSVRGSKYIEHAAEKIRPEGAKRSRYVNLGDIIISNSMSFGYPYIMRISGCIHDGWLVFSEFKDNVVVDYLYYVLLSGYSKAEFRKSASGSTVKNLNIDKVAKLSIPLPPVVEQERVVSRLELIKKQLCELSTHRKVLQEKIETVQAKVLDLAIRGRLVEQRSEETLSEEVLSLPEVEGPFEIPANWKWSRLKDIGTIVGGGTPSKDPSYWKPEEIAWVKPADFAAIKGKYIRRGQKMISSLGLSKSSARLMPKGSVIYSSRAPIGYVFIAENAISTSQGCKSVVPDFAMVTSDWIYYCLIHATPNIVQRASGTTFKEISGSKFGETLIPVPPLAEQRRICEVIEALQDKCSKLTALLK